MKEKMKNPEIPKDKTTSPGQELIRIWLLGVALIGSGVILLWLLWGDTVARIMSAVWIYASLLMLGGLVAVWIFRHSLESKTKGNPDEWF
jgi:hypothetical protein